MDQLSAGFGSAKSYIEKQKRDNQQGAGYLSSIGHGQKIIHYSNTSSILPDATKNNIPNNISRVNTNTPSNELMSTKFGVIKATPNQPADKLLNKDDSALSQGLENNFFTTYESNITPGTYQ